MCLAIVGRVIARDSDRPELAEVDVMGIRRTVNVGLIDQPLAAGDWVAIHLGYALEKLSAQQASESMAVLKLLGSKGESGAEWEDAGAS